MARELIVHSLIAQEFFMGFDIDKAKTNKEEQLNFFDLQMAKGEFAPTKKFEESSSAIDFDSWLMAHSEPEQSKTSRFITISATIHAAAILVIAMITVPLIEQTKTETITIELEEPAPVLRVSRGSPVPPTQGGSPTNQDSPRTDTLADVGSPGDVVVAKSVPKKISAAKSSKVAAKTPAIKPVSSVAAKTTFQAVPMTIDDIEAPELDQGALASTKVSSLMNEDFNEDFQKVDSRHKNALDKEQEALDKMTAALAEEQDENLNALDDLNKEEASRLASHQDSLRKKNAESIASALASERAAALAAAREASAKKAALAQKAGLGGDGNGFGTKQGQGAGNSGSTGPGTQLAGLPSGVRSLDQLRQMPGNPRPQYDREERRRGDQGEIAFIAYISKDGFPTKFRMLKSTGFRNLDSKTLGSLKKWRFYPGQEGWVELPFRWDLKGGIQEDGGTLRRSVSRR